jgi:RHS repeat-associated protein
MSDSIAGVTTYGYTPNGLNQYTAVSGQAPPVYDAKFNLSGYTGWTYTYDADKRLISVSGNGRSAQFIYDGLGRCGKRTIDGVATVYTYDEWKPIVEWTGAGGFVAWNLYGPGADEILVRNQPDPAGYPYYHLDAMGNVVFLLSQGSQAMMGLEKYTYDAFGKPTIMGWNGNVRTISQYGNRFLFTGREYLYTLGIYDYRHRHYHPGLGRFIQTDPIGFKGDAMNLYRYCGNNPINHSDPDGLLTRDFMWDFASYTDSSNNLQGLFQDFTNKWYAGENGGGGGDGGSGAGRGGGKSVSAENEDTKRNSGAQTRALDMLREEARGTNDKTGEIVLQNGEFVAPALSESSM